MIIITSIMIIIPRSSASSQEYQSLINSPSSSHSLQFDIASGDKVSPIRLNQGLLWRIEKCAPFREERGWEDDHDEHEDDHEDDHVHLLYKREDDYDHGQDVEYNEDDGHDEVKEERRRYSDCWPIWYICVNRTSMSLRRMILAWAMDRFSQKFPRELMFQEYKKEKMLPGASSFYPGDRVRNEHGDSLIPVSCVIIKKGSSLS